MINLELEVSNDLKKLLSGRHSKHVEKTLQHACLELGQQINTKIKEKGFAPRDTGHFAESHYISSDGKNTVIKSGKMAGNGTPLWHYIVGGHRTLTTERSRRWWFWYLQNVLGGSYTPKTGGGSGYVPPDRYHERAVNNVNMNTVLNVIEYELF